MEPVELFDSRKVIRARGRGSTGIRKWLCDWSDRYNYNKLPCEGVSKYTDGIPDTDKCPADDRLICVKIEYEGHGPGYTAGGVTYPHAVCEVTAHYAEVDNIVVGYQAIAVNDEWEGTHITIPVGSGRTFDDGTPCDEFMQAIIPMTTWTARRYFLYSENVRENIVSKQGHVNNAAFLTYPAETLRFDTARMVMRWHENLGALILEVTFRFSYFPPGWNKRWVNGAWRSVNPPLYPSTSFVNLMSGS